MRLPSLPTLPLRRILTTAVWQRVPWVGRRLSRAGMLGPRPRRPVPRWAYAAGGMVILVLIGAGVLAWRVKANAAAQVERRNPLLLDEPKISVQALDFTAVNLSGKTVKLTDFRGSVVVLNFWATWCVPCLEEMPALDRLAKTMAGRKFKVLAVDLQEPSDKVQEFGKTHRFGFDLLLDTAGEISSHYGVNRIPVTYVLDPRGNVAFRAIGPRTWDSEEGVAFFQDLIQAPTPVRPTAPVSADLDAIYPTQNLARAQ
jgi:peroxiredoxin